MTHPARTVRLLVCRIGGALSLGALAGCSGMEPTAPKEPAAPVVKGSYKAVSAGSEHACALTTGGAAYCWGYGGAGELGILDTGYTFMGTWRGTPVAASGGLSFASVSAGDNFTCGLTGGGAAYCWGSDIHGQLGIGSTDSTAHPGPAPVSGGLVLGSLSSGWEHACGVTIGGAAYCWGNNASGELGDGDTAGSNQPVPVSGGLVFASVSAGGDHTCGLTRGGSAYCWGRNVAGQLGIGASDTMPRPGPVAVAGGLTFASLSSGWQHTCGVTLDGAAYCWGLNGMQQVGRPSPDSVTTFGTPVAILGGHTFAWVSAGYMHTCGLTTTGAAYCWGDNYFGELGNGSWSVSGESTPQAVTGALTFSSVTAGTQYTCALTSGGAAYCWGANAYGYLGNPAAGYASETPVLVPNP